MFTYGYPCLLVLTLLYLCLLMLTYVYSCLPMFTRRKLATVKESSNNALHVTKSFSLDLKSISFTSLHMQEDITINLSPPTPSFDSILPTQLTQIQPQHSSVPCLAPPSASPSSLLSVPSSASHRNSVFLSAFLNTSLSTSSITSLGTFLTVFLSVVTYGL